MKTLTRLAAGAALMASLIGGNVFAQVNDQAKQTLEESAAAVGQLKSIQYQARRFGTGPLEGLIDLTGTTRIQRGATEASTFTRVDGRVGMRGQPDKLFNVANNGVDVTWLDHDNQKLIERKANDRRGGKQQGDLGKQLIMSEFTSAAPFAAALKAERIEMVGIENVDGVQCEVIRAGDAANTRSTVYHIGLADRLPRRMEMVTGAGENGVSLVLELTEVQVNPTLAATDLALALPPGYIEDRPVVEPTAVADKQEEAPTVGPEVGSPAPAFQLTDATGKAVSLGDYREYTTVLCFFGTKFPKSTECLSVIQEAHSFMKDEGIRFVGIACREDPTGDAAATLMANNNFTFDLLLGGDSVVDPYRVLGFPSFCVITPAGKVSAFMQGCPTQTELFEAIERAASGN